MDAWLDEALHAWHGVQQPLAGELSGGPSKISGPTSLVELKGADKAK
jgi:hypothetical protein